MADEPEPESEPWDPEQEKKDENIQREYLKLGKELLQDLKAEKEKKKQADAQAEEELRRLRGKMEAAPAFVAAYRTPTYAEVVKRLKACWAETKRIAGDSPPEVQTAVFHTLMQALSQSGADLEALEAQPITEGMNTIAQQVYETPFFVDLIEVWARHLRLKRSPYLFASQLADFMLEDRRVALFYNHMGALTWPEFLEEIKTKIPAPKLPFFETPEAEKFYDDVIELIAKRIESDYVDRGIVPSSGGKAPLEGPPCA